MARRSRTACPSGPPPFRLTRGPGTEKMPTLSWLDRGGRETEASQHLPPEALHCPNSLDTQRPSYRRSRLRRGSPKSPPIRHGPCRSPRKTRRRYASGGRAQTFLISRNKGSSSETYLSAASRTTHARDTFFFLAILSRESYVSDGIVTDSRGDRSALGEPAKLVSSAICIILHHDGANLQEHYHKSSSQAPGKAADGPEEVGR